MYETIVTQEYKYLLEESIGQLCPKFRDLRWYICLAKDEPYNVPLQNGCHFIIIFYK